MSCKVYTVQSVYTGQGPGTVHVDTTPSGMEQEYWHERRRCSHLLSFSTKLVITEAVTLAVFQSKAFDSELTLFFTNKKKEHKEPE